MIEARALFSGLLEAIEEPCTRQLVYPNRACLEETNTRTGSISPSRISLTLIRAIAETVHQRATCFMQEQIAKLGNEPEKPDLDKLLDETTLRKLTPAQQREKVEEFDRRTEEWDDWRSMRNRLNDLRRLRVTVESPQKTVTASSVEALKELRVPANLTIVTIEAGDAPLGYHANVTFDLKRPRLSSYAIEGRESQTVNGVFSTLDQELKEHQIAHAFAHKERYAATVSLGFSVLTTWALIRIATIAKLWQPSADLSGPFAAYAFVLFILLVGPVSRLLSWLFPFFTYSEDKQNGKRRAVKGVLSLVIGSLTLSLLYDAIRLLMLP